MYFVHFPIPCHTELLLLCFLYLLVKTTSLTSQCYVCVRENSVPISQILLISHSLMHASNRVSLNIGSVLLLISKTKITKDAFGSSVNLCLILDCELVLNIYDCTFLLV